MNRNQKLKSTYIHIQAGKKMKSEYRTGLRLVFHCQTHALTMNLGEGSCFPWFCNSCCCLICWWSCCYYATINSTDRLRSKYLQIFKPYDLGDQYFGHFFFWLCIVIIFCQCKLFVFRFDANLTYWKFQ